MNKNMLPIIRVSSLPTYRELNEADALPHFWYGDYVLLWRFAEPFKINIIELKTDKTWHYHLQRPDGDGWTDHGWANETSLKPHNDPIASYASAPSSQFVNIVMWLFIAALIVAAVFGYSHEKCEKDVDAVNACHYIHR